MFISALDEEESSIDSKVASVLFGPNHVNLRGELKIFTNYKGVSLSVFLSELASLWYT